MLGFAICKVACNLLAEYGFSVTQLPTITQAWGQFKKERTEPGITVIAMESADLAPLTPLAVGTDAQRTKIGAVGPAVPKSIQLPLSMAAATPVKPAPTTTVAKD